MRRRRFSRPSPTVLPPYLPCEMPNRSGESVCVCVCVSVCVILFLLSPIRLKGLPSSRRPTAAANLTAIRRPDQGSGPAFTRDAPPLIGRIDIQVLDVVAAYGNSTFGLLEAPTPLGGRHRATIVTRP